jgi:hypothetical protein
MTLRPAPMSGFSSTLEVILYPSLDFEPGHWQHHDTTIPSSFDIALNSSSSPLPLGSCESCLNTSLLSFSPLCDQPCLPPLRLLPRNPQPLRQRLLRRRLLPQNPVHPVVASSRPDLAISESSRLWFSRPSVASSTNSRPLLSSIC